MTDPTPPLARLTATWRYDRQVAAGFALMPDRRVLRRFLDEQAWTHVGDIPGPDPAGGASRSLARWLELHGYEEQSR